MTPGEALPSSRKAEGERGFPLAAPTLHQTDNDQLTREEVEAARALLRHALAHRQAGGVAA